MNVDKLGIQALITYSQFKFLKACLESHRKIKPKILMCVVEFPANMKNIETFIPPMDILELAEIWVFSDFYHSRQSWVWQCRYGLSILEKSGVEYVLHTQGDCIIEKPEGIHEIFDMMERNKSDIICGFKGRIEAATLTFLTSIDKAIKINDMMISEKFFCGHTLLRMERSHGLSIQELGYVCSEVENLQHRIRGKGTWGKILGFRHLHGEAAELMKNGEDPLKIFPQYYDQRYMGGKK